MDRNALHYRKLLPTKENSMLYIQLSLSVLKTSKEAPRCNRYLRGYYFLQRPFRLGDTGNVSEGNRKAKLSWNMLDAETTAEISFFFMCF